MQRSGASEVLQDNKNQVNQELLKKHSHLARRCGVAHANRAFLAGPEGDKERKMLRVRLRLKPLLTRQKSFRMISRLMLNFEKFRRAQRKVGARPRDGARRSVVWCFRSSLRNI